MEKNYINIIKKIFLFAITLAVSLEFVLGAADFAVNSFSCTPSEVAVNEVFSCTAQIKNNGDAAGVVNIATLYHDSNNWLENSNYPQALGTSIDPGQSTEVTFTGLRATKSGNNGFLKIMLDDVTDTYVADNNIKVNVINVIVTISNSASSAASGANFDTTATVSAGGNIDVSLTLTVNSGGCSIGNQASTKSITGMSEGNTQSRTWTVTQGTGGNCQFTISAAATGIGGIASKIDSSTSTVTCTNCPSGSGTSSVGGGGGGGGGSEKVYIIEKLDSSQTLELAKNEKVKFNFSNVEYTLTLKRFTESYAVIDIEGGEGGLQTFTLSLEEEISIDLDKDGISEISIKFKSMNIVTNKAKLILNKLIEEASASKGEDKKEKETIGEKIKDFFELSKKNKFLIGLILFSIVAAISSAYFLFKKRR